MNVDWVLLQLVRISKRCNLPGFELDLNPPPFIPHRIHIFPRNLESVAVIREAAAFSGGGCCVGKGPGKRIPSPWRRVRRAQNQWT